MTRTRRIQLLVLLLHSVLIVGIGALILQEEYNPNRLTPGNEAVMMLILPFWMDFPVSLGLFFVIYPPQGLGSAPLYIVLPCLYHLLLGGVQWYVATGLFLRYVWDGRRHLPPGCCQTCGYNLTGNTSGLCPECGKNTDATADKIAGDT